MKHVAGYEQARRESPIIYFMAGVVSVASDGVRAIKANDILYRIVKTALCILIAFVVLGCYTHVVCKIQAKKDAALYAEQFEQYRIELSQKAAMEAAERQEDPYEVQLRKESELLAKVLYGVKDNNEIDLRTYAWCVFNRVDNAAFPNTFEEVADQPSQWMRYSPDNPVVDDLYKIAQEEVTIWHEGHRPVTNEFVYMNWTPTKIKLRDRWEENSGTEYWRYGQQD